MTQASTQSTPLPEQQAPASDNAAKAQQTEAEKKAEADKALAQNGNAKS